ncbi:transmembrane protein 51 [Anolis carolinensis]|nr:PREDICTED: transmembrane protein 51 [Anolis carolinensis]XP_016854182.1 PREDICTED: transmembrane protein 51 [Anolis carolinensis]XP_016854183.1 PREDICTED: transmembrane protein 51 [Anolis carolinensis]|eukprot:XP_003229577.1 PREDICTED: transmembrane protein 51 [Anolis carolinensis]
MAQSQSRGSHYALTAIGLGMLVLGVIMAVWNLVPGFGLASKPHTAGNSSKTDPGAGKEQKSKTFSVAYVLVGAGVFLLLLSLCLGIRDRRKQRQDEEGPRIRHQVARETSSPSPQQDDSQEEDDETLSRYYVPSYEEVVNADYPARTREDGGGGAPLSMSLPSYESLTGIDGDTPTRPGVSAPAAEGHPGIERQPSRHSSRLGKRLKPLKVRRIKSEKLHLKDLCVDLPAGHSANRVSIEPLTPPPQYEEVSDKIPQGQRES